jgi:hypothetical protein
MDAVKKISLFPAQVAHVEKLKKIFERSPFALDFSNLGSGKSFCSSQIALELGFERVVQISPVSVQPKWDDIKSKYGIPIVENVSFCSIRSVKNSQPRHGLLTRRDYTIKIEKGTDVREISKVEFKKRDKFRRYLNDGVLLLIDEMQFIKNVTVQTAACQALVQGVVTSFIFGGRSRVLLLSGSPLDKEEQVATLFRTLYLMRGKELCRYIIGTRTMECTGIMDIVEYCRRLNSEKTNRILGKSTYWFLNEVHMRRLCYELFQEVFKPQLSSAMPPARLAGTLHKNNAFYHIVEQKDRDDLTNGVGALELAVRFDRDTGRVSYKEVHFGDMTKALVQIEEAKVNTFIRIARNTLMADDECKLVICLNYTSSLRRIKQALEWWNPLVLDGSTSKKDRKVVIDKFQSSSL